VRGIRPFRWLALNGAALANQDIGLGFKACRANAPTKYSVGAKHERDNFCNRGKDGHSLMLRPTPSASHRQTEQPIPKRGEAG
jgi:hypothetical protein